MDLSTKKEAGSFSLDPDASETFQASEYVIDTQSIPIPTLSPINNSPRLRKIDSFSQEYVKPSSQPMDASNFPPKVRITLGMCRSFTKELKTTEKIRHVIESLDEHLKLTELQFKKQDKRIDEFFQEIYDLFLKSFHKMAENYKASLRAKLQQEFAEYRSIHSSIKNNLETILNNDSFSKLSTAWHATRNSTSTQTAKSSTIIWPTYIHSRRTH